MPDRNANQVRTMFGRIVPRYDVLNRLMSLGMDGRWRRLAASAARPRGARVLDVGAGTGDLALELHRQGAESVVGADFTPEMLATAYHKGARNNAPISWVLGDALHLPFPDESFDGVTNAFVLRNLADLRAGLTEMARVLRPGGRLVCLDMTQPPKGPFGALYRVYFNRLVPRLAGVISGDPAAYRYLPNSLEGFRDAVAMADLLRETGLANVKVRRLGGGAVALHTGLKPGSGGAVEK